MKHCVMKVILLPTLTAVLAALTACASATPLPTAAPHHPAPTNTSANPEPTGSDLVQPDPSLPPPPAFSSSSLSQRPAATLTDFAGAQSLSLVSTGDRVVAIAAIKRIGTEAAFDAVIAFAAGEPVAVAVAVKFRSTDHSMPLQ